MKNTIAIIGTEPLPLTALSIFERTDRVVMIDDDTDSPAMRLKKAMEPTHPGYGFTDTGSNSTENVLMITAGTNIPNMGELPIDEFRRGRNEQNQPFYRGLKRYRK